MQLPTGINSSDELTNPLIMQHYFVNLCQLPHTYTITTTKMLTRETALVRAAVLIVIFWGGGVPKEYFLVVKVIYLACCVRGRITIWENIILQYHYEGIFTSSLAPVANIFVEASNLWLFSGVGCLAQSKASI